MDLSDEVEEKEQSQSMLDKFDITSIFFYNTFINKLPVKYWQFLFILRSFLMSELLSLCKIIKYVEKCECRMHNTSILHNK